jgi:hypothetical protein
MRRSSSFPAVLAIVGLVFGVAELLASCGLIPRRAKAIVALDEAFAAARPGLAARLEEKSLFGSGPAGFLDRPLIIPVALTESAGKAYDAAIAEEKSKKIPCVLVASPLIAKAILANGAWTGDPPLIVPEWRGQGEPGLWTANTDLRPAYRAAGAAAGAFVAALSEEGGSPSCGVIFSESPSRSRGALDSFSVAYSEISKGRPLLVRDLGEEEDESAIGSSTSSQKSEKPSSAVDARSAVADLLGSDIRVLFIALGSTSGVAIEAAERPGLAIGADFAAPETPDALAFRIFPNDIALAEAIASEFGMLSAGERRSNASIERSAGGGGAKTVPAILEPGPSARAIYAGKLDFAYFLSEAQRWRPSGAERRHLGARVTRERLGIKPLAVKAF